MESHWINPFDVNPDCLPDRSGMAPSDLLIQFPWVIFSWPWISRTVKPLTFKKRGYFKGYQEGVLRPSWYTATPLPPDATTQRHVPCRPNCSRGRNFMPIACSGFLACISARGCFLDSWSPWKLSTSPKSQGRIACFWGGVGGMVTHHLCIYFWRASPLNRNTIVYCHSASPQQGVVHFSRSQPRWVAIRERATVGRGGDDSHTFNFLADRVLIDGMSLKYYASASPGWVF